MNYYSRLKIHEVKFVQGEVMLCSEEKLASTLLYAREELVPKFLIESIFPRIIYIHAIGANHILPKNRISTRERENVGIVINNSNNNIIRIIYYLKCSAMWIWRWSRNLHFNCANALTEYSVHVTAFGRIWRRTPDVDKWSLNFQTIPFHFDGMRYLFSSLCIIGSVRYNSLLFMKCTLETDTNFGENSAFAEQIHECLTLVKATMIATFIINTFSWMEFSSKHFVKRIVFSCEIFATEIATVEESQNAANGNLYFKRKVSACKIHPFISRHDVETLQLYRVNFRTRYIGI